MKTKLRPLLSPGFRFLRDLCTVTTLSSPLIQTRCAAFSKNSGYPDSLVVTARDRAQVIDSKNSITDVTKV